MKIKSYGILVFLLYTFYHWYLVMKWFFEEAPNYHVMHRTLPLMQYLQGLTPTLQPPRYNFYGPSFYLTVHPLVLLSHFNTTFYQFYLLYPAVIALVGILAMAFFHYSKDIPLSNKVVVVCLLLNFQPLITIFQTVVPELWETAFILLAILLYRRHLHFFSGFCLAFASLMKLYPLVIIAVFLLIQRKVFFWSLVHLAILLLMGQMAYGWDMGFGYVAHLLSRSSSLEASDALLNYNIHFWENVSINVTLMKILSHFKSTPEGNIIFPDKNLVPVVNTIYLVVVALAFLGLTILYSQTWKKLKSQNPRFLEDFWISIGCLFVLLFGPHVAWELMVLSLPASLLLLRYIKDFKNRYLIAALSIYLILTGIIIPFSIFLKLTRFNDIVLYFLPQVGTRGFSEIYKFMGVPSLGLISLAACWFLLLQKFLKSPQKYIG